MILLNVVAIIGIAAIILMLMSIKGQIDARFTEILDKEREERQVLLDRIMSRDLHEFKFNNEPKQTQPIKRSNNFLKEAQEQAYRNMNYDNIGGED